MQISNGKLVSQESHNPHTSERKNENLIKYYEDLELRIATITQQQETMQIGLQKFDTRLIGLENTVSKYLRQFLLTNICGIMGLFILWFYPGNHQFNDCKNPSKRQAPSLELYHHLHTGR